MLAKVHLSLGATRRELQSLPPPIRLVITEAGPRLAVRLELDKYQLSMERVVQVSLFSTSWSIEVDAFTSMLVPDTLMLGLAAVRCLHAFTGIEILTFDP